MSALWRTSCAGSGRARTSVRVAGASSDGPMQRGPDDIGAIKASPNN